MLLLLRDPRELDVLVPLWYAAAHGDASCSTASGCASCRDCTSRSGCQAAAAVAGLLQDPWKACAAGWARRRNLTCCGCETLQKGCCCGRLCWLAVGCW
jgi:hypothetical protein